MDTLDAALEVERDKEVGGVVTEDWEAARGVQGFDVATGVVSREMGGICCCVVCSSREVEREQVELMPRCGECWGRYSCWCSGRSVVGGDCMVRTSGV